MASKSLMIQGVGSDVGKSVLTAGLARALKNRGLKVLPFKPQNMSNNAAVASMDGLVQRHGSAGETQKRFGEIGRAQALQARACGVAPHVDMNPILLKPQSDHGSQIVVQGTVFGQAKARDYYTLKPKLLPKVLESFDRLKQRADIILVEGAGSAAEVNLRAGDIANMGFALAANVPVAIIADIERGGAIASLVGAHAVMTEEERALVVGYIVNKFRGDVSLFDGGITAINDYTAWRCFGVAPWFEQASALPPEDSMALSKSHSGDAVPLEASSSKTGGPIKIVIPRLGRIANFDDFDPLAAEADVSLVYVMPGEPIPGDADLVILPGSKTTIPDLEAFRQNGWDVDLHAHIRRGGWVLGLCAGFQMLGHRLSDPAGIEGAAKDCEGLGWLDLETEIGAEKTLVQRSGQDCEAGANVYGYEMHMGQTVGSGLSAPFLRLEGSDHGAVRTTEPGAGRVMGCYLHGLFASDSFRHAFLARLRRGRVSDTQYEDNVEAVLNALAEHLEAHLDVDALLNAAR